MTRLDRVLNLLEDYDRLAADIFFGNIDWGSISGTLIELRNEKEKLTKQLIEHGCRREN
ncbi:MAG: hypothetical protein UH850_12640 [Paludibacteraceae bacterium]|nr:hypothetical protein [Paludibacteraceae bacterium]